MSVHYIFNVGRQLNFGKERESGGETYFAQRISDDIAGEKVYKDRVEAGNLEELARKVQELAVKQSGKGNFSLEFNSHFIQDEWEKKGTVNLSEHDLTRDEDLEFMAGIAKAVKEAEITP